MKWLPVRRTESWRTARPGAAASRHAPSQFSPSQFGGSRFGASRFEGSRSVVIRQRQASARRWAVGGAVFGALVATVLYAPASWLAALVARASGERVILAQAQGTVWSGQAVIVLTGGPGSRDAAALPGKLSWSIRPNFSGARVNLQQDCCLNGSVGMQVQPGLGRLRVTLLPQPGWLAQWPSSLLGGLGTPWNTLQLGGSVRLSSPGLVLEQAAGRWQMQGSANIDILNASSPLATLEQLGSYQLRLFSNDDGQVQTVLSTREGALQLSGDGLWGAGGVRFRGEARASEGNEAALNNLLNIIGRRDGARSIISIG